jgi:hypothetical protein
MYPLKSPRARTFASLLCLASLVVSARSSAEPDENAKKSARESMANGRKAREEGDLPAALRNFTEADGIMHVPTTALEVAKTQAALGSLVEAEATLNRIALVPAAPNEPVAFGKARTAAAELERDVLQRTPLLRFSATPARLSVPALTVDGAVLDKKAWLEGYHVNPGHHAVVAESGGNRIERAVDVVERQSEDISFDFTVALETSAKANEEPLPVSSGRDSSTRGSEVKTYFVYGLSALALGSAGAGIAFGTIGKSRKHDLEGQCAPNCTSDQVGRVRSMYTLANVSFGVSAASAISALVLYAVSSAHSNSAMAEASSAAPLTVHWQAGPASTGVTFDGKF